MMPYSDLSVPTRSMARGLLMLKPGWSWDHDKSLTEPSSRSDISFMKIILIFMSRCAWAFPRER